MIPERGRSGSQNCSAGSHGSDTGKVICGNVKEVLENCYSFYKSNFETTVVL